MLSIADYLTSVENTVLVIRLPLDGFGKLSKALNLTCNEAELYFIYDIALQLIKQNIMESCRLNKATCMHYMKSQLSEHISSMVNMLYRESNSITCSEATLRQACFEATLRQECRELAYIIATHWHQPLYSLCVERLGLRPDFPMVLRRLTILLDAVDNDTHSATVRVGAPLMDCRYIHG